MSNLRDIVSPAEYEAQLNSPLARQKRMTAIIADRLFIQIVDRNTADASVLAFGFDADTEYRRGHLRNTPEYRAAEKEGREMLREIVRQIYGETK